MRAITGGICRARSAARRLRERRRGTPPLPPAREAPPSWPSRRRPASRRRSSTSGSRRASSTSRSSRSTCSRRRAAPPRSRRSSAATIQVGGSNVVSLLLASSKDLPIQAIAGGTTAQPSGEKDFGALLRPRARDLPAARTSRARPSRSTRSTTSPRSSSRPALEKQGVDPELAQAAPRCRSRRWSRRWPRVPSTRRSAIEPFVTAERPEGRRGARLLLRRHRVRHCRSAPMRSPSSSRSPTRTP